MATESHRGDRVLHKTFGERLEIFRSQWLIGLNRTSFRKSRPINKSVSLHGLFCQIRKPYIVERLGESMSGKPFRRPARNQDERITEFDDLGKNAPNPLGLDQAACRFYLDRPNQITNLQAWELRCMKSSVHQPPRQVPLREKDIGGDRREDKIDHHDLSGDRSVLTLSPRNCERCHKGSRDKEEMAEQVERSPHDP